MRARAQTVRTRDRGAGRGRGPCPPRVGPGSAAVAFIVVLASCAVKENGAWPTQAVGVTGWGGYVETFAQARSEDYGVPGSTREANETYVQESLKLSLEGYAYHPNLFKFTAGGLFGLVQRRFEENYGGFEREIDNNETIDGFDFTGTILGRKNYPLTLRASKSTLLSPRAFRSSVLTTTERYGLDWRVSGKGVSNTFSIDSADIDLDPLDPQDIEGSSSDLSFRDEATIELTDTSTLDLSFEHRKQSEEPYDLDYDVDRGTIRHRQIFGDRGQHRLDSSLDLTAQTGTYDYQDVRWREWLRLALAEELRSELQFTLYDQTRGSALGFDDLGEQGLDASVLFEHRLYQSLVTRLELFGRTLEYDPAGTEDEYGFRAGPNYRKKTKWGVLNASYRAGYRHRTRDASGGRFAQVLDEAQVLNDPIRAVLVNRNVVLGSIFITAGDGITVYNEGADYLVFVIGDRTEIERLATGTIPNGSAILVDYVYDAGGSFDQDTWTHAFSIRHSFDFGLSLYYALFIQEQDGDVDSAIAPAAVFEDVLTHTVGAEFSREFFDARTEWEDRNSNIDDYETLRAGVSFHHAFAFGARPSLGVSWTRRVQDEPFDRSTYLLSVDARYRQQFSDTLSLDGGFGYRRGRDSLAGDDEGVRADLTVEWILHKLEVRVRGEYNDFDSDYSVNDSWLLYLQVRRNF